MYPEMCPKSPPDDDLLWQNRLPDAGGRQWTRNVSASTGRDTVVDANILAKHCEESWMNSRENIEMRQSLQFDYTRAHLVSAMPFFPFYRGERTGIVGLKGKKQGFTYHECAQNNLHVVGRRDGSDALAEQRPRGR